jgi:hypothetical protein
MQFDYEAQELLRAKWVMEKAIRDNKNVAQEFAAHMVSRSIAQELLGTHYEPNRKAKRNKDDALQTWVTENVGKEVSVEDVVSGLSVSKPTAYKLIKENPTVFVKVRWGFYSVRDVWAERLEAKANKV